MDEQPGTAEAPPQLATRPLLFGNTPTALRVFPALSLADRGLARRGTLTNGLGVVDDEQGAPIWTASGVRGGWAAQWPKLRHYD